MASFDAHVALVRRNTAMLDNVLIPVVQQHPDWVVTVAFYTALHMVEAMFFDDLPARHSSKHNDRHNILQGSRYAHIWYDYRPLYSQSRTARYLQTSAGTNITSFTTYCRPGNIVSDFINGHLVRVRESTEQVIIQHRPGFSFMNPPPPSPSPLPPAPSPPPSAAAGS